MAYQIKRKKQFNETLELLDENGKVVHTLDVSLDLDSIAFGYHKRYKEVVVAEKKLKEIQQGEDIPPERVQEALEMLGKAIITVLQFVFGDESAKTILEFYNDRYFEMVQDVFPFIDEVIQPEIDKKLNEQRSKVAQKYKAKNKRIGR